LLSDNYDNIKRYVDHISELYPDGLTDWGLGDWAPLRSRSPVELTSSAYYYTDVTILSKAAKRLNKAGDFEKYAALAEKIKTAINKKYLHPEKAIYADGHQTEQSVPLFWGIVPDSLKARVAANLADSIAANNYHLDVGILGAKAVLSALSDNGQAQTAWRLASQTTFPSWGWWIVNGATTLYENWNIDAQRDLSMNHIMFGEIGAWLFKGIGGIKPDENAPGFKHIWFSPQFVEGLDHFTAEHTGPYGNIISSWKREAGVIKYTVTIPANSTATIIFPLHASQSVRYQGKPVANPGNYILSSGVYEFEIR
ncbi:MAG TPA: alpha-L-rhamnosidase C-terminal domain-containing protein, partial [Puia sp.]|nr:alpha-L-rhamnosidase C-terminal domain-containing protein [Puia sp.]